MPAPPLGDRAHQARRPTDALKFFLRAIDADPSNYEALWKASGSSRSAEVSEQGPDLDALLAAGHTCGAAIRVRPGDADGHFSLASAPGRHALSLGARDGSVFRHIRDAALAALKINRAHPGAMHVLGMWNAESCGRRPVARVCAHVSRRGRLQPGEAGRRRSASWRPLRAKIRSASFIASTSPASMPTGATRRGRVSVSGNCVGARRRAQRTISTNGRRPSG